MTHKPLPELQVREIGRSLSIDGVGVTLGTGTTMALFHCDSTLPDDSYAFIILDIGKLSSNANILISLLDTSSGPDADLTFTQESSRHMACLLYTSDAADE